jgi:hypothetical protein
MTRMKRLFAGTVHVHYGTMHFLGGEEDFADGNECFEGQVNGLCGAAMRTSLVLRTGLHTGGVKVTVDFWDKEPPLEDSWEEVVEVSFVVNDPERTGILEWGGQGVASHRSEAGQVLRSVLRQKHGRGSA